MNILAPSILAADCSRLGEELETIRSAGVQWVHIDVMDGVFVPSLSFGLPVVQSLRKVSDLYFDVHLMITDPLRYIHEFAQAGADSITFHLEAAEDPDEVIRSIRTEGKNVGISIKPGTPVEKVLPYLEKIDLLLIMTVEPGFGGQAYIEASTERIREAGRAIAERGLAVNIEVDGGINRKTIDTVLEAGANVLVMGSAVFGNDTFHNAQWFVQKLGEAD
ncbi:MAG: ribulose-phosphate 3-epimerase [Lachnospiraceae bacterium]|nr:ribulose-phosphate 3-epimerase [Lachnospiraceae bacterium]